MKHQNRHPWLFALVVVMTAFVARADGDAPPVRVVRQDTLAGVSFHIANEPQGGAAGLATESADQSGEAAFYLFRTEHRGTIAVSQFVDASGRLKLASDAREIEALRRDGSEERDGSLFVYATRVEGASELFRLRNSGSGEELYTVDAAERSQRLKEGWSALPSLGWTQAIDSSGVGILKADTIKLAGNELEELAAVHDFGRELVFRRVNDTIAAMQPGAILYSERSEALPFGLVHRVDAVIPTGDGGLIVTTSPAELLDAFEEVHLYLQGARVGFLAPGRSGDWTAPTDGRPAFRSQATASSVFDSKVTKEMSAEWKTKSKGVEAKLLLTGKSSFGVVVEAQYSDSNACTVNPVATFVITPHQEYKVSIEASGSLTKEKEKELFKPITGTVLVSGIPLSATFTVYGGYEISGSLSAKVTFTETAQGSAVVRWDKNKKSVQGELCPKSCPSGFRCGPGTKAATGATCKLTGGFDGEFGPSGTASVYARPELRLYIGALGSGFGPYADVKLQLQARTESNAVGMYAQLIPEVGAKLKVGCWEAKLALATYNPPNGLEANIGKIPHAPKNVSATDGKTKGKVDVTWTSMSNVTGYDIYRATSATGAKTKLNSKLLTSAKYEDATVKGTTKYYYWVRAVIEKIPGPLSVPDTGNGK